MSNVPTNLIPTKVTGLPEYFGSSTLGYLPYIIDGRTYKVQFANIAAVGAVPSTREINTGSGLGGGGDLSTDRTLFILPGGVDDSRLSVTGVSAGTYGAADTIPVFTVNAQGRVTGVIDTPIVLSNYVPTSRILTAGVGLSGGGDLSANRTFDVDFSNTTPEPLGPGTPGVSTVAAREDHVHPAVDLSDTTETQGVLPLSRGGTGNSLSPVVGAVAYSSNDKLYLTPTSGNAGQVLTSIGGTGAPIWTTLTGTGTVTSVAVATANGFAGTVVDPTIAPIITLSTTVTGLLKGDGTGVSAATVGVDYVGAGPYTTSGLTMASARLLGRTTASVGAAEEITVGTGLSLASGSLVNAAPDQVVSLTGAGTTTISGAYPNFTITSADSTVGTVTSVNVSGDATGLTFTGGPITAAGTLTLGGTLAVASGGTGATDAATALTNLGAYPASNPAGYTSNVGTVTSVSGTGTVSGLSLSGTVTSSGSLTLGGTLAVTPSDFASQTANTILAAPNGTAGVPTFRSLVAADVPILNQNTTGTASNVTGIVAVLNGGTGASVAGTARTNLGAAASGANTDITSIALTTGTISTTPTGGTDIVNKAYADSIAAGINFHQSVRLATATTLPAYTYNNGTSGVGATLTANANGALSVDGVVVVVGNRILVKNEIGAAEAYNGVYTVTQVGNGSTPYILTRATDFDTAGTGVNQIDAGDFFLVTAGSTQANTSWVQQTPLPITVGTTGITFTQFAAPVLYSAGTGLTLAGTVFSITNTGVSASTYGSASSVPVLAINAQGQVTSASSSSIAIAASQITSGALAIANGGTGATDASGALTSLGAYPASNPNGYTSNTGTVTSINLTAGTGVSVSGGPITTAGAITVTNTAPDQVVSLTGSGATTVTGTYPNFTISSPAGGTGTVTSIDVSGGTTGLTTSGGPVTGSGTITLAGTLGVANGGTGATSAVTALSNLGAYPASNPNGYLSTVSLTTNVTGTLPVANGGTGATSLTSGYLVKGNGTAAASASVVYDDGTNVGIGTASPTAKLEVRGAGFVGSSFNGQIFSDFDAPRLQIGYQNTAITTGLVQAQIVADTVNLQVASRDNVNGIVTFRTGSGIPERMRIDSSGNVGIGTSSPAYKLDVAGAVGVPSGFNGGHYNLSWGGSAASRSWRIVNDTNAYGDFSISQSTTQTGNTFASKFYIDVSGNVGIGTTTPTTIAGYTSLKINNATNGAILDLAQGDTYRGRLVATSATFAVETNTGIPISFSPAGVERMRIDSSGNVGIGTSSPSSLGLQVTKGSGVASGILFSNAANNWQIATGTSSNFLAFIDNQFAERMRIDASGNVSIGTTVTSSAFCVARGVGVAGAISLRGGNVAEASEFWVAQGSGGTEAYLYNRANGPMIFGTNNAERMRIDASGNVALGTTTAASTSGKNITIGSIEPSLVLNATGGRSFSIASGNNYQYTGNSLSFIDNTAGVTRMLIDASGNLLVGAASSAYTSAGRGVIEVNGTSQSLYGFRTGGTARGYLLHDGTALTISNDQASGPLILNTVGAERARIHANGGVSIGNTVDMGAASLNVTGNVVFQNRVYTEMATPTTKSTISTLTGAEVMGEFIEYTGAAATLTMPTATNLQAAMPTEVATLNDISFDFTIVNTGTGTATLNVNTGVTIIGGRTTPTGTSTTFRIRKTATNTFIIYRT